MKLPLPINQNPLEFDPVLHKYRDPLNPDSVYTSVTQFISIPFDSDAIIQTIQSNPSSEYYGMSVDTIQRSWRLSGELGSLFHNKMENWINGNPDEQVDRFVDRNLHLKSVLNDRDMVHAETRLRFDRLLLAGTADIIKWNPIDQYWEVWDFKTSRKINPDKIWMFSLQIQLYVWMLKTMGVLNVRSGGVFWIRGIEFDPQTGDQIIDFDKLYVEAIKTVYTGDVLKEMLIKRKNAIK